MLIRISWGKIILGCLIAGNVAAGAKNSRMAKMKMLTVRFKIDSVNITNSSSCLVCNGSATVWVSGGFTPYTYLWSNSATTQTITGLCPGSYTITVADSIGDTIRGTCFIGPHSPAAVDSTRSTCSNTGIAAVYPFGGNGQYTYSWSNGATGSQITGVSAGTYIATVTDSSGCKCKDTAVISAGLHFTLSGTNVTCNADSNGSATASNVTDGTSPYTYSWAPDSGTNTTITGLLAGVYTITVTDSTGCSGKDSITITQPPPLITVYDTIADTGSCSGVAMLNITGGFPPYTFMWTPNVTNNGHPSGSDTAFNLCHGTYFLCTTDSHGCSVCDSVYIRNARLSGVDELASGNGKINVFPNPASNTLNVILPGGKENSTMEIYNSLGKQMMEENVTGKGNISVDVSGFSPGVYMLRVNNLNCYSSKLFTINH